MSTALAQAQRKPKTTCHSLRNNLARLTKSCLSTKTVWLVKAPIRRLSLEPIHCRNNKVKTTLNFISPLGNLSTTTRERIHLVVLLLPNTRARVTNSTQLNSLLRCTQITRPLLHTPLTNLLKLTRNSRIKK
jgi:hypothetical protein